MFNGFADMTILQPCIALLRDNYTYLSGEYGVRKIGIFGSVAKQTEHEDSDLDIVVEFRQPIGLKFIELTEYLEKLFGRKVDILTPTGIANISRKEVAHDIRKSIVYV